MSRYDSPALSGHGSDFSGGPSNITSFDMLGNLMSGQQKFQFTPSPSQTPMPNRNFSTPPTSTNSDGSASGRRTRGGRTGAARSTPKSKARRPKKSEPRPTQAQLPDLTVGLSIATAHMTDVPVADIDTKVNRPIEQRYAEAARRKGKKEGKTPRPQNSFILYRSAYTARAKAWCGEENHQLVSKVTGQSWGLEPAEVKAEFERLAKIERDRHNLAWPTYRFTPSDPRSGAGGKKRKSASVSDEDEDEDDNQGDIDSEYRPVGANKKRPRPVFDAAAQLAYNQQQQNFEHQQYLQQQGYHHMSNAPYAMSNMTPGPYPSSWQATNPGKATPQPYIANDETYYYVPQIDLNHNFLGAHVEDVQQLRVLKPQGVREQEQSQYPEPSLNGLPGGAYGGALSMDEFSRTATPVNFDDALDPALDAFDTSFQPDPPLAFSQQGFDNFDADAAAFFGTSVDPTTMPHQSIEVEDGGWGAWGAIQPANNAA